MMINFNKHQGIKVPYGVEKCILPTSSFAKRYTRTGIYLLTPQVGGRLIQKNGTSA